MKLPIFITIIFTAICASVASGRDMFAEREFDEAFGEAHLLQVDTLTNSATFRSDSPSLRFMCDDAPDIYCLDADGREHHLLVADLDAGGWWNFPDVRYGKKFAYGYEYRLFFNPRSAKSVVVGTDRGYKYSVPRPSRQLPVVAVESYDVASRPGLRWQSTLSRMLGVPVIELGTVADLPPARAYVFNAPNVDAAATMAADMRRASGKAVIIIYSDRVSALTGTPARAEEFRRFCNELALIPGVEVVMPEEYDFDDTCIGVADLSDIGHQRLAHAIAAKLMDL